FQNHVSDLAASITATETEIQEIDRQIEMQHEIQRLCEVYRHCRDVVTAEKSAKNQKAYQDKHEAEYDLHDRTMQELQALGITRIPSPEKIQKQLNALEEEKARVTKELQSQKKQQKTLQTVQANMQALLNGKALQKAIAQTDKEFQVL
ncbi:MAG: relaxase/mobilization nuclease, partial [Spirochaetia bacterium]|nr:relaxase/mobilization nuclease [Spirochaetia bacterium]